MMYERYVVFFQLKLKMVNYYVNIILIFLCYESREREKKEIIQKYLLQELIKSRIFLDRMIYDKFDKILFVIDLNFIV